MVSDKIISLRTRDGEGAILLDKCDRSMQRPQCMITDAGIAAGVGMAFSRVCLFVCVSVRPHSNRKTAWAINTKPGTRILLLYSSRLACIDPKVKGQGHTVTKTITIAQLLVTMAGIPYTYTPLSILQPLPAWVCMSIRLPMFSSLLLCLSV